MLDGALSRPGACLVESAESANHHPAIKPHTVVAVGAVHMQDHVSMNTRTFHSAATVSIDTPDQLSARLTKAVAAVLSGTGLFLIALTLIPFPGSLEVDPNAGNEGNIINQLGYLGLGTIYLAAMLVIVERRTLWRMVSPTWALIFAVAFLSCLQSYDPTASARGLMLSLVAMILVAGVLLLPRSRRISLVPVPMPSCY